MKKKVLITGGTGFIGTKIAEHFYNLDYQVYILTRNPSKVLKIYKAVTLEDVPNLPIFDLLINLAGEPIADKCWTLKQKEKIWFSRIGITNKLVTKLKTPKVVISASAVGWYGMGRERVCTEDTPFTDSFSHNLCAAWEKTATLFDAPVIIMRLGVVFGSSGFLSKMLKFYKWGLGSIIGSGAQYISWIDIEDLIRALAFVHEKKLTGVFNFTSPKLVTQKEFAKILSKLLNKPQFLRLPEFATKALFGQMGEELLLETPQVLPKRLQELGFEFSYAEIIDSLRKNLREGVDY